MKVRNILFVAAFFLTGSLVAQSVGAPALQITKDNRTMLISASDHAEAEPEIADVHVGFTAYASTLQAAYKSASDTSTRIIKAMTDAGADKNEIHSESQRVSRLQDYEIKIQKGMRFSVSQSWTVSVDPKNVAVILDAAVNTGANQSGDINWRMKSSVALGAEALRRATERAKVLGTELAKTMGVTLGKPLYATNTISSSFAGSISNSLMGNAYAPQDTLRMNASPAPLMIQSQKVERTATVEIVYAIE